MPVLTYEAQLDADRHWALREGGRHLEKESAVHKSLERIVRNLQTLQVPYALAGGMALFMHGYRRFTEDIDILVTRESLLRIHTKLEGRGGSKDLRDADTGVRIEFIVAGDYPGDGKPKPVAFPDPASVAVEIDGIACVELVHLIELKLASGMTNPGRLIDLADVQRLIVAKNLPESFAERLNPYVREKYLELWAAVRTEANRPE